MPGSDKIADGSGVIFNNGSTQTKDYTFVNGGYYNADGYVKTIEGAGTIPDNPSTPSDPNEVWNIAFDNSSTNWNDVYCYVWDASDGNREYLGSWPGSRMGIGEFAGQEAYTISFTPGKTLGTPMVIFNMGSNQQQTADLQLVNNSLYNFNGKVATVETGVESLKTENPISVTFENGSLVIVAPGECLIPVYRMDGTVITLHAMPGRNVVTSLEKGLYVIAGNKIIL